MDDWLYEEIPKLLSKEQHKSSWDDEDLDENDVKDSWEDEDEDKPATKGGHKKEKNIVEVKKEPLDFVTEKLRRQRLVEEADYKSTKELFGKKGDKKTLDDFIPKSESDFQDYAELISHKLLAYEKSYHYVSLLKAVVRLSMVSMKAADTKEMASSIRAITNEKLKSEKEANNAGKKKTRGKKKQLYVDKPGYDMSAQVTSDIRDEYDDFM